MRENIHRQAAEDLLKFLYELGRSILCTDSPALMSRVTANIATVTRVILFLENQSE